jgi:hypothetical protein
MNARWLCLVYAALVLLTGAARAQAGACPPTPRPFTAEQVQQGLREARDRGFLWRIEKDGRVSHLYGTVHLARSEWVFPGPKVVAALRASDVIALEIDLLDAAQQRRLSAAMAAGDAPHLPAALRERVEKLAARECVPPQTLEALAPESQVAALMALSGRRDGLDPAWGIDLMLAGFGRGAGLPVVSLETPELQAAALRTPAGQDRDAALGRMLDDLESGHSRPLMLRLAQVWADADHESLDRHDAWCDCRRNDEERASMQRLLDDRHPALADSIDALHRAGKRVFAAVGALHFVGPNGVQAMLAQRGYRVERVPLTLRSLP